MTDHLCALVFGALVALSACAAQAAPQATKTLVEWHFNSTANAAAWTANGSVNDLAAKDGCLTGRAVGTDPTVTGPRFEIGASPYQYIEIRMRVSRSGPGEIFWTNTTEDPYGGFRPEWFHRMEYTADGFRIYRIFPFWQDLKTIIRLRIDPPEDADFAVDYVKIVEITAPPSKRAFFDFSRSDQAWLSAYDPRPEASAEGIMFRGPGERSLVSPKLELDSQSYGWLSAQAKVHGAESLVFEWVSDKLPGVRSYTVTLRPDQDWHTYNISTDQLADWVGTIQMLGMRLSLGAGQDAQVRLAGASARPMGPAELEITDFMLKDVVNRVGKAATVQAEVLNVGGESAQDVRATLVVGQGASIRGSAVHSIAKLPIGERKVLTWRVSSTQPGPCNAQLTVSTTGGQTVKTDTTLRWDPPVHTKPGRYVPEPHPVRGDFEVGMYYFPGWYNYSRWAVLDDYPERRPLLGYYREGDPEVADWQIKWMVEHGVTFIIYDWYWSAGARQLEHGIHQGFFHAKYHDKIKFCLLWANHNPPKTSSAKDMADVTNYWLDNYFLRPDYYKVDGKPVVVIFSAGRLTEDLGVDGVRQTFDKSREMAEARGLAGVYFVACTYPNSPGQMKLLEQEGYDALSGYNYPNAGDKGQNRAPYADMVTGYQEFWNAIVDSTTLRYIPVTEPGWDARPWHGPNTRVRTGKTPALFEQMLENAKQFVEQRTPNAKPKMVFVEAWNEFGEGDYVEPHREFGFGHLDAIRSVFTNAPEPHEDLVPQDVVLGPYEFPKPKPVTAWEFNDPASPGWAASQNLADGKVENGCLIARAASNDPAFYSDQVDLDSKQFGAVAMRMRVDKGKGAQLFWASRAEGFNETASARFDLIADSQLHVYRLDLAASPAWRSKITSLRLDPTDTEGATIAVDYIRFITRVKRGPRG